MPQLIESPSRIPVPGGKVIDEYVGRVSSSTPEVSVAHMRAPAGWGNAAMGMLVNRHQDLERTDQMRGDLHQALSFA